MDANQAKTRIERVLLADKTDFNELVALSGLNPVTDFRNVNLSDVDFGECDLSGFDFTNSMLRRANLSRARAHRAIFEGSDLEGATWGDLQTVLDAHAQRLSHLVDDAGIIDRALEVIAALLGGLPKRKLTRGEQANHYNWSSLSRTLNSKKFQRIGWDESAGVGSFYFLFALSMGDLGGDRSRPVQRFRFSGRIHSLLANLLRLANCHLILTRNEFIDLVVRCGRTPATTPSEHDLSIVFGDHRERKDTHVLRSFLPVFQKLVGDGMCYAGVWNNGMTVAFTSIHSVLKSNHIKACARIPQIVGTHLDARDQVFLGLGGAQDNSRG